MKTFNLFTYGTILKGNHNHKIVSGATFVGDGVANGYTLYDYVNFKTLQSYYPVAIEDEKSASPLLGEVYECPKKLLPWCDALEGEGELYKRKTITANVDGKEIQCYIYVGIKSVWLTSGTLLVPYDMSAKYRRCQYTIEK